MSNIDEKPLVGFVIVSWNNHDLLKECFESVQSQDYKNTVTILVDNGSKDESVKLTRTEFPWIDIYEAGENLGFAKGNNIGVNCLIKKHPNIQYIVFLNTDARLESNWTNTMIDFAKLKPRGALFQSTTLDYYDHDIVDSTHTYISRNGSGTQANWRAINSGEKGPKKVFGVNAAAALLSTSFLQEQPFNYVFDETMFMYLEDVDLSARTIVMGWDNYLVPGTFAYHMGSASSGKTPGFSLYMTYRNNIAILVKNIPIKILFRMLPSIFMSDYRTIRHLRRIGQADGIPKIIKGRLIGFVRLPLYFPGILKMSRYRHKVSKDYLWQLMKLGD